MKRRVAGLLCLSAVLGNVSSQGETITVNSMADLPDADLSDGVCDADLDTPGEQRTLRAAVQHANVTSGLDEIALPTGTIQLKIKGVNEGQAATGDLDVRDDLVITGAGATSSIINAKKLKDRIFDLSDDVSLTIRGVALKKGRSMGSNPGGGAIRNDGGSLLVEDCLVARCFSKDDAGAILHLKGDTTVRRSQFVKNKAVDDGGAFELDAGTVLIEASAFIKNRANHEGGAIECDATTLTILNTTFSGNVAKNDGGALSLEEGATTFLINCTLANNHSPDGAGISSRDDVDGLNTTVVQNTIFANEKKNEFAGSATSPLTSMGGNIDSGKTCGFGTGDLSKTNAKLQNLKKNGGPTPTHGLKGNSPAIDRGNDTGCPPLDQRGLPRVDVPGVGEATCDSGAYEVQ